MSPIRYRTRPPVKQDAIIAWLRRSIVDGELAPGQRLPPRTDIERRFQASPVTVQRALERMIADGFVTVAGSQGTFVADFPPHLHHYAMVFPVQRDAANWRHFWSLLADQAERFSRDLPTPISLRFGVEPGIDDAEVARLAEDLAAQRLSGIIFASDPWQLKGTPLVDHPGVPRVTFSFSQGNTRIPGISLGGDGLLFFRSALDRLIAQGRRRIALLTVPGLSGQHLDTYRAALAERGLPYQPWNVQVGLQDEPQWAAHLAMLLFRGAAGDRPDGLIIADDHLVDHACAGLIRQGMRIPEDVAVVAHANFPIVGSDLAPIARLGYDIPGVFATGLDLLGRQRAGQPVPRSTVIAPVFAPIPAGARAGEPVPEELIP
jgi:DNA-binding LacI/PurR family transcriptional regulator